VLLYLLGDRKPFLDSPNSAIGCPLPRLHPSLLVVPDSDVRLQCADHKKGDFLSLQGSRPDPQFRRKGGGPSGFVFQELKGFPKTTLKFQVNISNPPQAGSFVPTKAWYFFPCTAPGCLPRCACGGELFSLSTSSFMTFLDERKFSVAFLPD